MLVFYFCIVFEQLSVDPHSLFIFDFDEPNYFTTGNKKLSNKNFCFSVKILPKNHYIDCCKKYLGEKFVIAKNSGTHYLQIAIICPESLLADIISCRHFLQVIMFASKDYRKIMTICN